MGDIILNDIKRYLRSKNKNIINLVLTILLIALPLMLNASKTNRYGEYLFLLFFSCVLFQGIYGMYVLVIDVVELNDTKFLFTMPIRVRTFICAKNILIFVMMIVEFLILEMFFVATKILNDISITKNLSFITTIIFTLAISNIYLFLNHKKFIPAKEGALDSVFRIIKQGFSLIIVLSALSIVLIFLLIKSNISPIVTLPAAIVLYTISFKILEKKLKYQSRFFEEVEDI
ncbi:MAG: hypothetical protein AB6733_20560 [Clostridiaceae bacterium]